jgi:hypothetical protein
MIIDSGYRKAVAATRSHGVLSTIEEAASSIWNEAVATFFACVQKAVSEILCDQAPAAAELSRMQ